MNELLLFLTLLEKNNCDELTFLHESNRAEWIVQICFALTPVSRKRNDVKIYQEKAFRYWVEKHVWKEAHDGGGLFNGVGAVHKGLQVQMSHPRYTDFSNL